MSFVPRLISENWRLKLAALGLAVFLWAVVRAEPGRTATRMLNDVPVLVEVADLNWTTAGPPQPARVDVRIASSFPGLAPAGGDFVVRIPVEEVTDGDTVVELRRDWVVSEGNGGVSVQDITPTRVRLTFERTRTASIPLYLTVEGSLPEGLALAQPLGLNPSVVRVRGRASRVDALDSLALGPLDLSSVQESGTYPVPMDTAGLSDLTLESTQAAVQVRLEEKVGQPFAGIPVRLDTLPEGIDSTSVIIDPATLQVTLQGGRTRVANARAQDLRVLVPGSALRGLDPGEVRMVPVRIQGVPTLVRAFSEVDSVQVGILRQDAESGEADDDPGNGGGGFPPSRPVALRSRSTGGAPEGGGGAP